MYIIFFLNLVLQVIFARLYIFIKTLWHIVLFVLQLLKKMGTSQQFSLRWNNYLRHITCAFDSLRSDEDLVDVTLSCEGKRIRAHKMLLSACSTYFRDLFKVSVWVKDVISLNWVGKTLVTFLYCCCSCHIVSSCCECDVQLFCQLSQCALVYTVHQ